MQREYSATTERKGASSASLSAKPGTSVWTHNTKNPGRKAIRSFVSLAFVAFCMLGLATTWGCGESLAPCETTEDCRRNASTKVCVNKLCYSQCGNTCVRDTDCNSCGGENVYRCRNGTCKPMEVTGPESKVYEQCGGSSQKNCPQNMLCQKPSADASFGYCYPQCSTAQSKTCDDGKGGQGTCSTFLEGDLCLPTGTAGKFAACGLVKDAPSIDLGRLCSTEFSCVRLSSSNPNGFCLPKCDPKLTDCDNSNGDCQVLNDGTGVCVPRPQGKDGDACEVVDTLKTMDPKKLCQAQFYCAAGSCKAREKKGVYEKCNDTTTCGSQGLCIVLKRGANFGYCLSLCNKAGEACENQTGTCLRLGNGQGACVPGTAAEGAACGERNDPEKLDPGKYCKTGLQCGSGGKCEKLKEYGADEICSAQRPCKPGLRCIAFSQPGDVGLCLPIVNKCEESSCDEGRVCLSGQTGGICGRSCKSADDCPPPSDCKELSNNGSKVMICTTP